MLDLLKMVNGARGAGDNLQQQFPPDWILRTGAAALKRWFLNELAQSVSMDELAREIGVTTEQARAMLETTFDYLRRKM